MLVSPIPALAGNVLATEWAHIDQITIVSVQEIERQMNTIWVTCTVYLWDIWIPLRGHFIVEIEWPGC